ncbi:hypothetical protein JCM19301_1640 [Jejuia pallidilutea]|uniref:Uncharacterized protein n=1 Tax=Jejuia pallidilutea TaxID=504487 RepID=A0A090WAZ0_9FLAO|nr:hypothetical protein JCM19301_1640 [Jejuia pallidilutea]GAL72594.1 hypothetical protein JCM19302_2849 [Jejuia pallidilutea]GAL89946.1 hypothetical protein JCM19538_2777 [Jejuia pallidilutea]
MHSFLAQHRKDKEELRKHIYNTSVCYVVSFSKHTEYKRDEMAFPHKWNSLK